MSSRGLDFIMNKIQKSVQSVIEDPRIKEEKKLKWESEAVNVIKNKIAHRRRFNLKNDLKLKIYESKLRAKYPIISQLNSFLKR